MRTLSILVTTVLLLVVTGKRTLNPKGPPCPEGDGLYAVGCNNKYLQCVNNVEYEQQCPENLFFDRLLARCERRSANYLCNTEYRKSLNVRQKAVLINCIGRPSGDYPLDSTVCNENYYQCANGIFYMRKCPYDQYYSSRLNRCDYESNCLLSEDVKRKPAAAYAAKRYDHDGYEITAEEVQEGPKGVNCAHLGDATISNLACSPYFWQCSNGKLFRKTCPAGLIYVLKQNLCDFPHSVPGCPEYNGSDTYVPAAAQPTTVVYHKEPASPAYAPPPAPAPYTHDAPPAHNPDDHFSCKNLTDGFYEIGHCYKKFLTCSNGQARVITCAHNLVYDARVNSCEFLHACQAPRKQEDVPQLYNHGGHLDKKPVEVPVDFDCSGRVDGEYVKKECTKEYFRCSHGRAFVVNCPSDLVYNTITNTCDFVDNCGKIYIETVAPPTSKIPAYPYTQPTNQTTTVGYEPEITNTFVYDTTAPTEGYKPVTSAVDYSKPTTTVAYEAPTTTAAYEQPVITSTVGYQPPATTTTAYEQLATTPTVGYEAPTTTTTAAYQQPSTTTVAYEQPATTPTVGYQPASTTPVPSVGYETTTAASPPHVDDFSCANLENGNYASGLCKNVFYACSNKQVLANKCPGSLIYNPYLGQCDYEENVPDCEAYQEAHDDAHDDAHEEEEDEEVHGESYTRNPELSPVQTPSPTPRPHAAFCERLEDGNYGLPCKPYFFQCINFATTVVNCPDGLFYDLRTDKCEIPKNVEGCPGYEKQYPNIDYTTPVPGPIDTTPIAEHFSCFKRTDGIYALPYCTGNYVQCVNGRTLLSTCSNGLFYDELTGLCDYKENVTICKIRHGADLIEPNSCFYKPDGYYSAGCSSHYFSCIDETVRKMECPNKLRFSQKKGVCDYPSEVKECAIHPHPDDEPALVPHDFCVIRPDGLHHFQRCSSYYVVCHKRQAISGTCAAPLVFNEKTQLCDYKSNNRECDAEVKGETYYQEVSETTTPVPTTTTTVSAASDVPEYTTESTTTPSQEIYVEATTEAYAEPTTTEAYSEPTTTTKSYY